MDIVLVCFVLLFQYCAGGTKSLGQGNRCSARNSKVKSPEYRVKMQTTKPRLSVSSPNDKQHCEAFAIPDKILR
jgi:hypothetical protein